MPSVCKRWSSSSKQRRRRQRGCLPAPHIHVGRLCSPLHDIDNGKIGSLMMLSRQPPWHRRDPRRGGQVSVLQPTMSGATMPSTPVIPQESALRVVKGSVAACAYALALPHLLEDRPSNNDILDFSLSRGSDSRRLHLCSHEGSACYRVWLPERRQYIRLCLSLLR